MKWNFACTVDWIKRVGLLRWKEKFASFIDIFISKACKAPLSLLTEDIIIGHYNPSVRIIDLVSHTTYVVCVNFIHKWRELQFTVDSERQIFLRNFSWQFYLLSEFLPEICWEEIAEEILFVFHFEVWPGARTLAFRLIS